LDHDSEDDQTPEIDVDMCRSKRSLYKRVEDFDESDDEGDESSSTNEPSALVAEEASATQETLLTTVEQPFVPVNEEVAASTHNFCLYGGAPDGWKELCQQLGWKEPETTPEIFSEPVGPLNDFCQQQLIDKLVRPVGRP